MQVRLCLHFLLYNIHMIDRYSREEIKKIWDLESKFSYYLKVELAVCEAYAKLGQIPNVMQVHNAFLENGTVYMIMEYIDGASVDLYLYSEGVHKRVFVDDIFYVTRENRRTVMVTRDGAYPTKESFDDWCARLPAGFFYPVHKSFLVNLHDVERYSYSELYLTDGTRIPVAPRRQAAFHKFWFAYLRRR